MIVTTKARELVLCLSRALERQTVAARGDLVDNAGNADGTSDAVRERFPEVHLVS